NVNQVKKQDFSSSDINSFSSSSSNDNDISSSTSIDYSSSSSSLSSSSSSSNNNNKINLFDSSKNDESSDNEISIKIIDNSSGNDKKDSSSSKTQEIDIKIVDEKQPTDTEQKEYSPKPDGPFNRINKVYEENKAVNQYRAESVKEAMKFAWDNYKQYAWGRDELNPVSKTAEEWFGFGITIMDSIDTLFIMGLKDEFKDARDFVENLDMAKNTTIKVSVFEANIRVLGGLLSAYHLTEDPLFLKKAKEIGTLLLDAFDSSNPFPKAFIDVYTKKASYLRWTQNCALLAEVGTMFLEFEDLSLLTGNSVWKEKSDRIIDTLSKIKTRIPGLVPTKLKPEGTTSCAPAVTIGAMGDSYYEYLLKMWIYRDSAENYREMYLKAANSIIKNLYKEFNGVGFMSTTLINGNPESGLQEHLACFLGGMFALGAAANVSTDYKVNKEFMYIGEKITETCAKSYELSPTGLGPEHFLIKSNGEFKLSGHGQPIFFRLRPETVESLFILYRLTGDTKYQEWGWNIFEAINKYCRISSGYVGLKSAPDVNSVKDDRQQSYFMAETLKYLYLLFTDSSVIPLDEYVFNTEAHPIKIIKKTIV
ncbi:hypothetical protein CYY_009593, partial [Polysphondylium violaceum]